MDRWETYPEPARAAKAWGSYTGVQCLAFGTASHFFIYRENNLTDITPFRGNATAIALTDPFTTASGDTIVSVTDTNHGITDAGVDVSFDGASAVGGITIDGEYEVVEVINATTFTIEHTSAATSTATGGGSVSASYTLNPGNVDTAYLVGWGVGLWGEGVWGEDVSLAAALISDPTNWAIDVYGEDLIINRVEEVDLEIRHLERHDAGRRCSPTRRTRCVTPSSPPSATSSRSAARPSALCSTR